MKIWNSARLMSGLAIVMAVSAAAPAQAAPARDWRTIRIGIDALDSPFSAIDLDHVPNGFDIAIARALCDRLKARCDFVPTARAALLSDLLARKSDAVIASETITEERRKTVDFTDKYHTASARFAISRTSGITDISPDMMRGQPIGAVEGSRFATYLTEVYAAKGAVIKLYKTDAEAEADLRVGRVAAVLGDAIRLYRWVDDGVGGRCCRFIGPEIRNPKILGEGAGIAIRKEDVDLRDLLNKALADILRDGTYEKVNAAYFNFLVY